MFKTKFHSEVMAISSVLIQMLHINDGSSALCKTLEYDCGNDAVKDNLTFLLGLMA